MMEEEEMGFFNVETIKEKERDHYSRKPTANMCNICPE